jgi:small-conductance mechanosensitive channel/CRP-like cAMP-binding protein
MLALWMQLREAAGLGAPALAAYVAVLVALAATLGAALPAERRRLTLAVVATALALLVLLAAGLLAAAGADTAGGAYRFAVFLYMCLLGLASVNVAVVLLFRVLLRAVRLEPPPILRDLLFFAVCVALLLTIMSRVGVNLTGIVATSAVATAVLGFALQDTLGNIIGGVVLQLDRSIRQGDWIRIDGQVGVVREIRWRHTSVETNEWHTLIVPNSQLIKSVVVVLGRRSGQPQQTRRDLTFNVDYRTSPGLVIAAAESALRSESIPHVAADPPPNCVFSAYEASSAQYTVRYWLTDWAVQGPTDSLVRARLFAALRRAGIEPALPMLTHVATIDDPARRQQQYEADLAARVASLRGISIFAPLHEEEITQLARDLRLAPFADGETITRQGATAHWLYIVVQGQAEVRVVDETGQVTQVLACLGPGSFFGEMGLLTGEPRSANVVARGDVVCYRLDKEAFLSILQKRPEIASEISRILALRRAELDAAREGLDQTAARLRAQRAQADLLDRILGFFKLS